MPQARKQLVFKDRDLWYLVGLIATDGNLSPSGRHINITSKEYDYLEKLKRALGLQNKIGRKPNSQKQMSYQIQIANTNFYEFLLSIGLTPRKSLTLGVLRVPDEWFADFMRGVIDGDGNIRNWIHPSNGKEQWVLRIYSASHTFVEWLSGNIKRLFQVTGSVQSEFKKGATASLYILKYGKIAAKVILRKCYYKNSLSLERKARLADECRSSRVRWTKSKTSLGVV
jgi:hypothetical protein